MLYLHTRSFKKHGRCCPIPLEKTKLCRVTNHIELAGHHQQLNLWTVTVEENRAICLRIATSRSYIHIIYMHSCPSCTFLPPPQTCEGYQSWNQHAPPQKRSGRYSMILFCCFFVEFHVFRGRLIATRSANHRHKKRRISSIPCTLRQYLEYHFADLYSKWM
jgi:hypothetical protein